MLPTIFAEAVMANINNFLELSHAELDLVVLAKIQACTSLEVPGENAREVQGKISYFNGITVYISMRSCTDAVSCFVR